MTARPTSHHPAPDVGTSRKPALLPDGEWEHWREKAKAAETVLRSAFTSERTSLAIMVVPFRASCRETRDRLAAALGGESINVGGPDDIPGAGRDIHDWLERKRVLVVTPLGLLHVLQENPEVTRHVGLWIH